jgi:DNA-binding CsgD family transcriptional regulator
MFINKSNLLEQINFVIHNKWSQKNAENRHSPSGFEPIQNYADLIDKNYSSQCKNTESIEKLEYRIAELEQQNEQLLGYINFLFENLPELIMKALNANTECKTLSGTVLSKNEVCEGPAKENNRSAPVRPSPTRREKDILGLLMKGLCAKEIAHELFISETTVITHKKNLKEKFNARNTAELISKVNLQL